MSAQEEIDLPSSILDEIVGANVRNRRESAGLSLGAMAERMVQAGRPMTYGRLGALERGIHKWTTRDQYAAALLMLPIDSPAADLLAAYLTGGPSAVALWLADQLRR